MTRIMTPTALRFNYDNACNDYLKAFCEQYGLDYDNNGNKMWVGCEPGGLVDFEDMCFGMPEITLCVDKQITWDEVLEWTDYNSDASYIGLDYINFQSWFMGYRGTPKEKREELKAMRRNLEECIENENKKNTTH